MPVTTQKIKLLKLWELLHRETDELNPMPTNQVCSRLNEMGISCDRRTLSSEIAALNECGYEIMTVRLGKGNAYYVEDRAFSVPELKVLIDAVQGSNFLSDKKTKSLISKIASLAGAHKAELLSDNIVWFNTRKHSNEHIYYNISALEDALLKQIKTSFHYFDLDERGSKVYRRNGNDYIVEPVSLVFHEDNYYLIAYSSKHDGLASYRVDRMDGVNIIEESISTKARDLKREIGDFTEQAFKMYGGDPEEVTLEFDDRLTGPVFDKFGENTKMVRVSESSCRATVTIQVSPVFWGWVFQFAGQLSIVSPKHIKKEYRSLLEKAAKSLE